MATSQPSLYKLPDLVCLLPVEGVLTRGAVLSIVLFSSFAEASIMFSSFMRALISWLLLTESRFAAILAVLDPCGYSK